MSSTANYTEAFQELQEIVNEIEHGEYRLTSYPKR